MLTIYVASVVIIILSPYCIAAAAGMANGTYAKIHNLNKFTDCVCTQLYSTKISYLSVFVVSIFYCITMGTVVCMAFLSIIGKYKMNVNTAIFVALAIFFLANLSYTFCEMRISNGYMYIYNIRTIFMVKKVCVGDIVEYGAGGFSLQDWIYLRTKDTSFSFYGISNAQEFVEVMDKLKGGASE